MSYNNFIRRDTGKVGPRPWSGTQDPGPWGGILGQDHVVEP